MLLIIIHELILIINLQIFLCQENFQQFSHNVLIKAFAFAHNKCTQNKIAYCRAYCGVYIEFAFIIFVT